MGIVELTSKSIAKAKTAARPGGPRQEVRDQRQRNLVLRIGPRGVRWALRLSVQGEDKRLDLGGVDDWTIAEAREIGSQASRMLRNKLAIPDLNWVHALRIEYGKVDPLLAPRPLQRSTGWTFAEARERFLDEVQRTHRPATYDDYRARLHLEELKSLENIAVAEIDRHAMSKIVEAIHKSGREAHAEHLAAVIRPMWTWLSGDNQIGDSKVTPGEMVALRAPPRTRDELPEPVYLPSMTEVGRIVAIARSGVLDPAISAAVQLTAFTVQRRLTVVSARKQDFEATDEGGLWRIPSAFMKARSRGRKRRLSHVVPLPSVVWRIVQKAVRDSIDPASEWLFPQFRPRHAGGAKAHMSASTLTRALLLMPDVVASPHDLRRAFATHGEQAFGLMRYQTKSILDHGEGEASSDITAISYSLHDGTHHKWGTMRTWTAAVDDAVRIATKADPRLLDAAWLLSDVGKRRYGGKRASSGS